MKLKFVVYNDNNFISKMFKPPDNRNTDSEDNQPYFQHDAKQNSSWHKSRGTHQDCSCYHKDHGSYQQNQQKLIYQNNKTFFYRTSKWLQFCRIAYPDPYSGPGPGPGCTKCSKRMITSSVTSRFVSIISAKTRQTRHSLPQERLDEPVVVISPTDSQLPLERLWLKWNTQQNTPRARSRQNNRQKHQKFFNSCQMRRMKYQKKMYQQGRMFGRNFLWLLIILMFFDSGPLKSNGDLTALSALSRNNGNVMRAPSIDSEYNKERDTYNNHIRTSTPALNVGNNNNYNLINYTKFLNSNAYNNRNDIMMSSNTYNNINSKYSFNDYKNLFLNYDISSNTNDKHNTNQYSSTEITKNKKSTNSNKKISYISNTGNTSNTTNTYMNNMSNENDTYVNKMVDSSASFNSESQKPSPKSRSSENARHSQYNDGNTVDEPKIADTPNPTGVFHTERHPSVTTLIMQKKNSMKASLHAIRNFKADEVDDGAGNIRPFQQKFSKNVSGKRPCINDLDRNQYNVIKKQSITKKKNKLKNKRTTDNTYVNLDVVEDRQVDAVPIGELQNQQQQPYERQKHGSPISSSYFSLDQYNDQQYQQDERNIDFTNDQTNSAEQLQQLKDDQHKKHRGIHHNGRYFHQSHNHDQQVNNHQSEETRESYQPTADQDSPMDYNYKRSLLASIGCPNCVYNMDPHLAAELFAPSSLLSASPMLSSSSSPSSSAELNRYQNGNQPIIPHQYQQYDFLHQQHPEQYLPYPHNSLQYSTINSNINNNNNKDNFINYDNNNPRPYYVNKKLNINNNIYYRNTNNNANSNNFHQQQKQPFHQFDSDQIRLESIKHQILSKLGLKTKPNVTQTLPKQFIMETIYRAESSGRNGLGKSTPTPIKYSDSSARGMMSNSFGESELNKDQMSSSVNDFFYSDYTLDSNKVGYHPDIKAKIVSLPLLKSHQLSKTGKPFSPYILTRRTGELASVSSSDIDEIGGISSDESLMIDNNSELGLGYLHQQQLDHINGDPNMFSSSSSVAAGSLDLNTDSPMSTSPPLALSSPAATEQDDFFGRTKEIITFAEKGGILNGHRLIEFSSLSDQMTGQNLRIRTAFMWIRVDLRSMGEMKRHRTTKATTRLKPLPSILKVWVFRLIEPYATNLNTTEFVKKDFDHITTLSTTLNVQFNQLGWQKLDITETVKRWYAKDRHLRLRLLVDCSGCGDLITLHLFGSEPARSTTSDSHASKTTSNRPHHDRITHHRHQHQRNRLSHTRKPGQRHPNVPNKKQQFNRAPTNRTSPSFREQPNLTLFLNEELSRGGTRQNVLKSESRSKPSPAVRNRSNEITKPKLLKIKAHTSFQEESSNAERNNVDPNRPFLVIHTEPNVMKRVRRRALDCSGALNGQCCKESFYVSFKALGWDDWIIAPHGYFANYCRGDCAGPRTPDTYQSYHTHVMEEFRKLDRLTGMQPCCAPLKFSSMSLIYYGKEGIIKRDLPKMVVDECGCP